MATTFELQISCEDSRVRHARQILVEAHREIARLERELSEFREGNSVALLNIEKAYVPVALSADVRELLQISERLRLESEGAFNPLCKSREEGAVLVSACGQNFFKTADGVHLSFGAVGKGYALDRVKLLLDQAGFSNYLLSAGGSSVLISGFAAPGTPWQWAWSWKKGAGAEYLGRKFVHHSGRPIALGVSGTMEQGQHILGGRGEALSALVAHGSAARADALSTALFVLGWDNFGILRDPLQASPVALIDSEENLRWNGDFQTAWGSPCN